jgi:phosphoribosylaminoimidazole carboxylase PurE protein
MNPTSTPRVLVVMGSASDQAVMAAATETLEALAIPFDVQIRSAHRTPAKLVATLAAFEAAGGKVIIAGAGLAAHLAGACAAHSMLPVIAVPLGGSDLGGLDALLSSVQMPKGVPVATVAIGKHGAINAALLAAQMLALADPELAARLKTLLVEKFGREL